MKNFVLSVCILVCIISLSQSRPSFYYSNKDTSGYHAPYDFIDYNNNGDSFCSPLCNTGSEVIQTNNNYTQVNTGQCNNVPDFFTQQNQLPGLNFDSCCGFYQSCAQTCGNSKDFCDQQFYGCLWAQCGTTYVVRPGDRIICRSFATCYASWYANNVTCDRFNNYQNQACVCVPSGNQVPLPSPSSAPSNPSASSSPFTSFSSSPAPSSASVSPSVAASPSSSPAPVGKRQAGTSSSSSETVSSTANQGGSTSTNNNVVSNGRYISRPIPGWSNTYSQCPPSVGNYINVMSDQEMDDISMWNSASS